MTICCKLTEFQSTGNSSNPTLLMFIAFQKRPEGSNEPTLNVIAAWNSGYTGRGITVGVVDDGVDGSHPDLRDNYVTIAFPFSVFFLILFNLKISIGAFQLNDTKNDEFALNGKERYLFILITDYYLFVCLFTLHFVSSEIGLELRLCG